jgi:hypothetical protein
MGVAEVRECSRPFNFETCRSAVQSPCSFRPAKTLTHDVITTTDWRGEETGKDDAPRAAYRQARSLRPLADRCVRV